MSEQEARAEVNRRHPQWHDNGMGIVQGSHYRSGFIAGAEWRASRKAEVTDDMVEKARAAWLGFRSTRGPDNPQNMMRAALVAALGGADDEQHN